ncbi:hypothetical protein NBRC110019_05410 [Neptunitalea chrysea]|uniref:Uncharacterized protein n=1 Tax=Neptunitalea chrysea TaxID=1647581 RepID=A0A9W6EUL9_9FLAO|nr:hypothetical protein [Neptunitalea chrysea]GLB51502.1 hypothetical protein NBRC110019_05410 [Neptunitalea chrysea]
MIATNGWSETRTVYFAMSFSKPFKSYVYQKIDKSLYNGFWRGFDQYHNFPEIARKKIKAYFDFFTAENETIEVNYFGSSPRSI